MSDSTTELKDITAISAGLDYTVALKDDGTVWAWGCNGDGQLGDGTTTNRAYPVQVKSNASTYLENITMISAGSDHTVALKDDGTVWAWGYNYSGQLGDGTTTSRYYPVQVMSDSTTELKDITVISAGTNHTVALKDDGTVWAWGNNDYGRLGDGTTTQREYPVQPQVRMNLNLFEVLITGVVVSGTDDATTIETDDGTLQMLAEVLPANATNKKVTWSVTGGVATISKTGLLTALSNGTVTVKATAVDGSGVYGEETITISNQIVPVASITVTGTDGATTITTDDGTLQMLAEVLPVNANNKDVTWYVPANSAASIDATTGVLTALFNGTVIVKATAVDGSGVFGTKEITISGQVIPVTDINVTGTGGISIIDTDGGTIQMLAEVLPSNATNKNVTWSVSNSSVATISTTGLLTAVSNGTVTVKATATDGSEIFGEMEVTINNLFVIITEIVVTGTSGSSTITTDDGTLQMIAAISPDTATNKNVTWSVSNDTIATINATGLLTAVSDGTVTVKATAVDGSGVYGEKEITISGQVIPVTGITVTGEDDAITIETDDGTLQMSAAISPTNATNKNVTWSVPANSAGSINATTGLLTALFNGSVLVTATAADGSGVTGTMTVVISNQIVPVTGVTVTGTEGRTAITTDDGTLQMTATVSPDTATNKNVTWSVSDVSIATISTAGILTAISNGTVTVKATAVDGSGVYGEKTITISNQIVPVASITVTGTGGSSTIITDDGTLQMLAEVLPANATNKTVTWSVPANSAGSINATTGLLTALFNGSVVVTATAADGSGVTGTLTIVISNQIIPVTEITVSGEGNVSVITTEGGTLQMLAEVLPSNATNKDVTWHVSDSAIATISTTGLLTAVSNGTVIVKATAADGSGVFDEMEVTVNDLLVVVTEIIVSGTGGASSITTDDGTLQMTATVSPEGATNKDVIWSVPANSAGSINATTGLLTALFNGSVLVTATAADGSGVTGTLTIVISNQIVPVTEIVVTGTGGSSAITTYDGTLQMTAAVSPGTATNKNVTWSVTGDAAAIDADGLLTAKSNGIVTVKATAVDGSGVFGTKEITITGQTAPIDDGDDGDDGDDEGNGNGNDDSGDDGSMMLIAAVAVVAIAAVGGAAFFFIRRR